MLTRADRRRQLRASQKQPIEPDVNDEIGTAWMIEGACRSYDTNLWFTGKPSDKTWRQAMKICADCPVRLTCLQWALQWPAHDLHGIWGGTSQRERIRIQQKEAPTWLTPITLRTTGRISGIRWNDSTIQ